ncbi:MAG: mismatch-specific DNA-glycosylase [Caldiserica bacterium]|nr:mismatch-specific DNA-glycosylase [Caldisericota bacterium]
MPDGRGAGELIPDVLADGLRVVFCGSALGDVSWERRAYYANPGNRFWQTLAEVGLTPRQLTAEEYPRLANWGIGLTDLVKTDHGQDTHIFDGHVDLDEARRLLRSKVLRWQPRVLAFTSRTVAAQFLGRRAVPGRQPDCLGRTVVWVLPSTSGLARRFFDIGPWQDLARFVRDAAGGTP